MSLVELHRCISVIDSVDILFHCPFSDYKNVHPTEESEKEDDLWDELEEEIERISEVQ